MIWQKQTRKPLEAIARTGFLVSLTSYIVFWLADAVQPGLVSRYFSVHVFLLSSVVFGVVWSRLVEQYTSRPLTHIAVAAVCGVLLALMTWPFTQELALARVPLLLLALAAPVVVYESIRT